MLEAHARTNIFVITAHGEWDFMTAPALAQMLREATSGSWPVVVVDLSDVTFMDSAGCAPLCDASERCQASGIDFMIIFPPPNVEVVLGFCDLAPRVVVMDVVPHLDEVEDLYPISRAVELV